MQAQKSKEGYYLEELRITNNRTVFLGYEALISVYPNLTRLYAGNTLTILDNLKIILKRLPKLQILDVSLCSLDYYDMAYIDFRELLEYSDLKTIFMTQINEKTVETLLSCGVEIVENTIGDILLEIQNEDSLLLLEQWLRIGGDVNLMCQPNHELCSTIFAYPQIEAIKRIKDEALLRDVYKLLINYGLDLSLHTSYHEGNLLNAAITEHITGLVYLLVSNGSDISPCVFSIATEQPAMTLAATLSDMSLIQIFLDFELYKIDYYSPKYCNPICASAGIGDKDLFNLLIDQGVPLFPCGIHPNILIANKNILEMVLSPEFKDVFSFPLDMLYEAAQYYIIKLCTEQALLILKNLDETIKQDEAKLLEERRNSLMRKISSDMHKPLLILATERRLKEIMAFLIENGYDINSEDMHGWTPFISACSYGYVEFISYLCENGALVNKRDKWFRTGLHQAAQNGHSDVVRELIRYGAALSPECDKGLTPLNYAIVNRREDTEKILREHGAKASVIRIRKICSVF